MPGGRGSVGGMVDGVGGGGEGLLISHGIGRLVVLFERLGRCETAALLHGMLESAFPSNPCVEELPATMTRVREALGKSVFDRIGRQGAAMDLQKLIDVAQGEISHALAELGQIEHQASSTR